MNIFEKAGKRMANGSLRPLTTVSPLSESWLIAKKLLYWVPGCRTQKTASTLTKIMALKFELFVALIITTVKTTSFGTKRTH